ncbi:hypothetical protein ACFO3K_05430 [Cellulomonas algicola]|uniref:hypothetical protein n=1 Tax=Cellulomonas algicola TaxID=2071633 RepID=UPI001C3F6CFD|nr:hypothetical protein [Cellulomonas algicola]
MRTRTVRTPVGPSFDVAVQWAPRWARVFRRARRRHRRSREGADVAFEGVGELAGGLDDLGGVVVWIVGAVAFVFGVLLVWLFLVPLLLVVLDLLVVVVVLTLAFLGRLLLRRPWTVAVTPAGDDDTPVALADVMGWNRALRVRDAIGGRLAAGASPEQAVLDAALGDKAVTARVAGGVGLRG